MGRKNKNKHKKQNIKQQSTKIIKDESLEVIEPEVVIEVIEPMMQQQTVQTQPVMEQQTVQAQPVMEQQTVQAQPVMEQQTVQAQPVMEQQVVQTQPVMNQQTVQTQPVAEQQVVQTQPVMNQQVVQTQPVMNQQVVQMQPVMNQQTVQMQPVIGQPVMQPQQMVVEQVMQNQPAIEKQAEEKPKKKVNLLITKHPKSSFSESIKSIRTNLQFSAVEKEIKVILLSSPEPGDGKSLISSNLAGAYAQENKKVLIIDCDLRKGRQAEIFNVKKTNTTGYTNLILKYNDPDLDTQTELEDYICKTDIENVDLIPNGPTPPNPIELLSSSRNKELIDDLKEIYDIIILDCPPVLGLSDALVMTKYSDANIIVISKGKTKLESLAEVKRSFDKVNSTITGVVTNKAKAKHNSYYGYYGD